MGMCFLMECMTGFFDIFMALVLSQFIIIGCSYLTSKYSSVCFTQITWVQQDAIVMYSASAVESEMEDCFFLDQDRNFFCKKNADPLVPFWSSTLPSQSTSINSFKLKCWIFGYHNDAGAPAQWNNLNCKSYLRVLTIAKEGLYLYDICVKW